MNLNTIIPGTYKFLYKKILQLHENYMSFIGSEKVPQSTLCLHTIPKALALGCDLTLNPKPYHGNRTLHMPYKSRVFFQCNLGAHSKVES